MVNSLIKKIGYLLIKFKRIKEGLNSLEGFGSVSVLLNGYGRCEEAICIAVRCSALNALLVYSCS